MPLLSQKFASSKCMSYRVLFSFCFFMYRNLSS
jgi:hypothetical protein